MNKRGLSTIVATLLIVLIAISAVLVVWKVINKQTTSTSKEIESSLDILTLSQSIKINEAKYEEETNTTKIIITNTQKDINNLNLVITNESNSQSFSINLTSGINIITKEINLISPKLALLVYKNKVLNSKEILKENLISLSFNLLIISPQNTTYNTNTINFNITADENLDTCIYTLNNWQTNISMTKLNDTYFYNITQLDDGSYTAKFWCNDTNGNINNKEQVSFSIDTRIPISSCTTITSSGEYTLTADIIDSTATTCINIQANNVILDCQGHTIGGKDTSNTNGIYIYRSSAQNTNIKIKNCIVSDWYYGIYFYGAESNILEGIISNSNYISIYTSPTSPNNKIINCSSSYNNDGVQIRSQNNKIINCSFNNNQIGVRLRLGSDYTELLNSFITNNSQYGIYLYSDSNNLIYNNLFNNTNNFYFDGIIYANNWNTTKTSGTNIVNGPYLGGNFWAKPDGTGFSETCSDSDSDGICDSAYTLASNNIDYLPLTYIDTTPPQISFVDPTPTNGTITSNTSIIVNISIIEENLNTFIWNWNGTNYSLYDDSLVLMFNFNNVSALGENATKAVDLSKYGNNGTIINAVWTTDGKYGSAMSFDGNGDYVSVPISVANSVYTISLWVKTTSSDGNQWAYAEGNSANSYPFLGVGINSGKVTYLGRGNSGSAFSISTTDNKNDGNWHHIVAIQNAFNDHKLYVDGNYVGSSNTLITSGTFNEKRVGSMQQGSNSFYFQGNIDEVYIYNRSLSADEIKQLYYSNLYKYDKDKWQFITNQSNLSVGTYTYQGFAKDIKKNLNNTESRVIIINK
ncbi:MAG: NosD domain-containing protein [Candidatus Pacearchaeota archaeon]